MPLLPGLEHDHALPLRQHDASERHHGFAAHCFADDRKRFLTDRALSVNAQGDGGSLGCNQGSGVRCSFTISPTISSGEERNAPGRRYIFLKNVDHLTLEEKEALSRLEAQNLDTIQAMHIRMNLQQLFTMDAKTARRFLDRWNAWVQVCDLAPMKRLAKTIMAKAEGILRSIATGLSNGVLEAINGNVQAAKRKAKGYRTKRNLKAIVYLIAGDVLANSPT